MTNQTKTWIRLIAGSVTILILQACATNPVSGERQLMLVSEGQEVSMGTEGAKDVENTIGLVNNPSLQSYVNSIGMKLAANSERPNLPWSFKVVDDPTPNAFALPGGPIFITRGLMSMISNEAELASVLGHEIGHVTARHSANMMSRAQVAQIGLGVASILSPELAQFGDLASTGMSLLFLKYGRDAERQADDLGFQYAMNENYDVREMSDVFASLQRAGELAGESSLPSWMASHPNPGERIERIEGKLGNLNQPMNDARVGTEDYMNQVDGLPYGENPRQGYFEDTLFLQPEMEFRITFPKGWQTQNLSDVVQAGSPDNDAIVQLMLAPDSPEQAANKFFSQQGVQAGRVREQTINRLPAVVGQFQAQSQGGTVAGYAAFIELNNNTYQIIAFSPAQVTGRYDKVFQNTINSFARLTDRNALAKRGDEIEIVRTDNAMTLSEFNRRYPSVVEMDTLALINQVPNANTSIPARTLMKRVVQTRQSGVSQK